MLEFAYFLLGIGCGFIAGGVFCVAMVHRELRTGFYTYEGKVWRVTLVEVTQQQANGPT